MLIGVKPAWADDEESWQRRCLRHLLYNRSIVGMLLIGALDCADKFGAPAVGDRAVILPNGTVVCAYLDPQGNFDKEFPICNVTKLVERLRKMADDLKLSDGQRKELFGKVRQWIKRDFRIKKPEDQDNEWDRRRIFSGAFQSSH